MFQKTTAQAKIAALRNRVRVVQGGTSSSKTFSIIPLLITYAAKHNGSEISIVSESIPHLRRGAIRDFVKIMEWTGNFNQERWNRSSLTYTFANGSFIEFFSADQPDKMRGARRDVLFMNEANNINWETYMQLSIRTRKFIYIDYNPSAEFWAHTELIGQHSTDFVILTYKDNEALEPAIVAQIESAKEKAQKSEYWRNWWNVYGLGLVGALQGVVFNNWSEIDRIPEGARFIGYGVDFGYTNDPTTVVKGYEYNGERIYDEVIYQTGLLNNDIANLLKANGITKRDNGFADSADPKSIADINRYGFRLKPVIKGADSIMYGVGLMQEQPFKITSRSVNFKKELNNYCWAKDKDGVEVNKPIDAFNHAIDAARYLEMMVRMKPVYKPIRMKF